MIYFLSVFICGLLFGMGLAISQLINPEKVLGFLDITGNWDPSLLMTMLGAVLVAGTGFKIALKKSRPVLIDQFFMPALKQIDKKLVIGSAIFGIGWGLAGYCPGPGIAAAGLGIMDAVYFVIGMILSRLVLAFFRQ